MSDNAFVFEIRRKMSYQNILDKLADPNVKEIYGYMYGTPYIYCGCDEYRPDKIVAISKSAVRLGINNNCLIYIWGWPGPDANIYKFADYGVTWAFSKREIDSISLQKWLLREGKMQ